MNTHIVDSINWRENWWYMAHYDGGWAENNVYRMDHYPYKDKMYISFSEAEENQLEEYYRIFREEIQRKRDNGGKIIVPEVIIRAPLGGTLIFSTVFSISCFNCKFNSSANFLPSKILSIIIKAVFLVE